MPRTNANMQLDASTGSSLEGSAPELPTVHDLTSKMAGQWAKGEESFNLGPGTACQARVQQQRTLLNPIWQSRPWVESQSWSLLFASVVHHAVLCSHSVYPSKSHQKL